MQSDIPKKIISLILLCTLLFAHSVFAQEYTSSNFTVSNPLFGVAGTHNATSTSFQMTAIAGQTGPGLATSSNFTNESGFEYFDDYTPRSQNWRWYNDENNETPTSALEAENTAPNDIANNNTVKLRLTLGNQTGVAASTTKIRLQYSEYSDFSQDVGFVTDIANCTGNSLWCYGDGVDADDDAMTTLLLSDSTATGTHNEAATTTTTFSIPGGEDTEMEFTIKSDGPRVNTTYYFRPYNASTSEVIALGEGESYPSLATAGAALSFTISGLELGTTTEGITTDLATTPTSVPFGDLTFDSETEAAQRMEITTNATEGYQLFVYERQGLLHYTGSEIDPISTTNAAPGTWAAGCPGGTSGCYGYHAGDDTLAGGSSRFAVDNTYAQFDSTPREVAYSNIPVESELIDMVYKVEVEDTQIGGDYEGTVVYIITPVF